MAAVFSGETPGISTKPQGFLFIIIGLITFPDLRYALHMSGFKLIAVSHTHIKPVSYLYAIYAPWMWMYTRLAFRKEKDAAQRQRNQEILTALYSPSLLFGECLMLTAKKACN